MMGQDTSTTSRRTLLKTGALGALGVAISSFGATPNRRLAESDMTGVFDTIDRGEGDAKSIVLGLSPGLTVLAVRYWAKGFWPWLDAYYGGASILINTIVTVAGMWTGTVLYRTSPGQKENSEAFFAEAKKLPARREKGLLAYEKIVAYSTAAVCGLLVLASVLTSVSTARITDLAVALFLAGLGWQRMRALGKRSKIQVGSRK